MIDISELDKAEVLAALYNAARFQGMGLLQKLQGAPEVISYGHAKKLLTDRAEFDYVYGKSLKVNLTGDQLDPCLYDRDNGSGAARSALEQLLGEIGK